MYFRFLVSVVLVVLVSLVGIEIEQDNRSLQQEMLSLRAEQEKLTHQIVSQREEALLLGVTEQKLQALEEGRIALPSPQNPSQLVQSQDRSLQ
ncbi:MAG: hypothetical protein HUJ26_00295 [Planctomycetaceae bacterium]|nr:hypothetical protein [Planctomycetaceae bacterium]